MSKVKADFHVQSANSKQSKSDSLGVKSSKMPVCKYEILENNVDGPLASLSFSPLLIKQTRQFYHKWSCELGPTEKEEASALCFRVHSCLAQSLSTKQLVILDKEGCSLDKFLLNNLQYTVEESNGKKKLVAGQLSQVNKYTDHRSLYLQCQIKLWRLPLVNKHVLTTTNFVQIQRISVVSDNFRRGASSQA
uniref:ZP domain-containing protein n=1 Tax=Ditylenchus dipsaci TaxID=166011 RepID=A0A915CLW9_9BILA